MAKTNYGKVEKAIDEELRKMEVQSLLKLTKKKGKEEIPSSEVCTVVVKSLKNDLIRLHKQDKEILKKLEIERGEIKQWSDHASALVPQEWEKIKQIKTKLEEYKKGLNKKNRASNEQLVKKGVQEHINKRHNVRDKWLPIDTA